ncbi:DNA-binding protein [Streptomyces sp. V2]|uniref:PIN domain-containing protein n=2 Tax=Streptomyces niveiscabiei TaxID=164115 RepID=A0ABW9HXG1_9ACTN|nr:MULTISPECIES: PIN domain-containing protein [unclassified Streptomyces]PWG11117.1 DNA-binding protein [Streptomyces sp. V2]QZZ28717.1 DNA-binding protein [Streptomyces sp. ST1015]
MTIEFLVLDSQGLSSWIDRDRKVMLLLEQAERDGADVAMSAATIIEASYAGVDTARLNWLLSRVRVEAVTKDSARRSAQLLKDAGLHGHKYAIDAMVAEVALRLPGPVAVLTSDADDMVKLCGKRVRVVGV